MECFTKALGYCRDGLADGLEERLEEEEMYLYNSMGFVQLKHGQIDEALKNYNLSLSIAEKIKDMREIALSHENIGDVYIACKQYDEALQHYKSSENLKRRFQNIEEVSGVFGLPKTYNGIARILIVQGKIEDAKGYLRASYSIAIKCGDVPAQNSVKRLEAECCIAQGNKEEGRQLLKEVLKETKEPFEREELIRMINSL
jgi:tetratricopeptide (TPR) repeat protein